MTRKRNKKIPFIPKPKRTLETAIEKFQEECSSCKTSLEVIKFKQENKKSQEIITATCFNTNFRGLGVKCENYGIPVIFRYCKWF